MKHLRIILIAAGALAALLSAAALYRGNQPLQKPEVSVWISTSSQISAPSVSPDALAARPRESSLRDPVSGAKAAAAADISTGAMLYEFHSDTRWPVASITKIMTAQ